MSIKLVTIDIDDTLVNSQKEITARVKTALNEATAQGVKVVLATGRPLTGVTRYLDELGLNQQDDQYVITYNGGVVETTSGQRLGGESLTRDDFLELQAIATDLGAYLQVETLTKAYTTNTEVNPWASLENYLINMDLRTVSLADMPRDEDYVKMIMIGEENDITQWYQALPKNVLEKYYVVQSTPHNLEFMNKVASKGAGLAVLRDILQLDVAETMALGDQQNDLTMIETAGLGIAMGNAIPALKQIAQAETTTQNEDGVGVAIEKYVLNA